MKRIIVLGGGFAGLWSAVGAARRLDELDIQPSEVEILLLDRTDWHAIGVRNYERNLADVRVGFDDVLSPIGVSEHKKSSRVLGHEILEIAEAVVLAVVAITTAWSGYQSALWAGHQA